MEQDPTLKKLPKIWTFSVAVLATKRIEEICAAICIFKHSLLFQSLLKCWYQKVHSKMCQDILTFEYLQETAQHVLI